MATMRVHQDKNFTVLSNEMLRENNMSLKAKGLLAIMLSLPDDWDYSVNGLVAICKEKLTAVKSALEELKANGYLRVTKLLPNETESGHFEYVYDVYASKSQNPYYNQLSETDTDTNLESSFEDENLQSSLIERQDTENQEEEKQDIENLHIENPQQLNKDKQRKDKQRKEYINNMPDSPPEKGSVSGEIDKFFDTVWKAYPRKEGKGKVSPAAKKRLMKYGLEQILRCIERYKEKCAREKTERRFIQHGSTFFTSGYVDFLDENYADTCSYDNEIIGAGNCQSAIPCWN